MMKKFVERTYLVFLLLLAILFVYITADFDIEVTQKAAKSGYELLPQKELVTVPDASAPQGIVQEYVWEIRGVSEAYRELIFYSYHQNIEVFLDEEPIYRMAADSKNPFGRTPGCVWNSIMLEESDNGRTLRVVIVPVYQKAVDRAPDFYFGTKFDIVKDRIRADVPDMILGVLAVLAGLIFIVFTLYNYRNAEIDISIWLLGLFAVQLGIWKLMDTAAVKLMFPGHLSLSIAPYLALMLICVPLLLFLKELFRSRESIVWYVGCFISLITAAVVLILQFTGITDMSETLVLVHASLAANLFLALVMVIREVHEVGWNPKLKRNALCLTVCACGFALDVLLYYLLGWQQNMLIGMTCFMVYIFVQGYFSMKGIRQLMNVGMHAKAFERMAYHDQLTGLYNRTAYDVYVNSEEFRPEHCIVVALDLNDLKKCNDTLGHEKGDLYIRESAQIIEHIFGEKGRCYRMGGDEFCVLIPNGSIELCKKLVSGLKEMVDDFNRQSEDVFMEIACGYVVYDKRLDYDIRDTSRRADKMMYQEKFAMKQK